MTADDLAQLITEAAHQVRLLAPAVDAGDTPRRLAFGGQLDVRIVGGHNRPGHAEGESLTAHQVAGYLAQYATKSATDDTPSSTAHQRRLQATITEIDRPGPGRHADQRPAVTVRPARPMVTDAWLPWSLRHQVPPYSITLGQLRRARQRAQARIAAHRAGGRPLDLAALEADLLADDDAETTVVIGRWQYLGSGWANDGERALATAAAARAREYDQWKAQLR